MDLRNWVHLFESRCKSNQEIFLVSEKRLLRIVPGNDAQHGSDTVRDWKILNMYIILLQVCDQLFLGVSHKWRRYLKWRSPLLSAGLWRSKACQPLGIYFWYLTLETFTKSCQENSDLNSRWSIIKSRWQRTIN